MKMYKCQIYKQYTLYKQQQIFYTYQDLFLVLNKRDKYMNSPNNT